MFYRRNAPSDAVILDFRLRLGNRCRVSPAELVVSTMSASDSNLRCGKEEWSACSGSRDDDPPRPVLIFVAAKKNGSACSGSRDDSPRPILIFVAADKRSRNEIRENRDKPFQTYPYFQSSHFECPTLR